MDNGIKIVSLKNTSSSGINAAYKWCVDYAKRQEEDGFSFYSVGNVTATGDHSSLAFIFENENMALQFKLMGF